eukprot:364162-Chlamydomonas_euryale.AAC.3
MAHSVCVTRHQAQFLRQRVQLKGGQTQHQLHEHSASPRAHALPPLGNSSHPKAYASLPRCKTASVPDPTPTHPNSKTAPLQQPMPSLNDWKRALARAHALSTHSNTAPLPELPPTLTGKQLIHRAAAAAQTLVRQAAAVAFRRRASLHGPAAAAAAVATTAADADAALFTACRLRKAKLLRWQPFRCTGTSPVHRAAHTGLCSI